MDKVDKLLLNGKKKNNVKPSISTPSGDKTVKQVSEYLTKQEQVNEMFATTQAMIDALQLVDLSKTESRTFQTYSRDTLRTYLKSPKNYESQIRNLSRYLYRLCYEYKRICYFYATMVCGDVFNIVPLVDPTKKINENKLIKNWYATLSKWQRMNFENELTKLLIVAWREDTVYGYVYDDSDQEGGTCFYQILDGDYCRVSSIEEGVFRFAFDFSYFRSHSTYLDYWDSEFKEKYEAYENDSSLRWQELDPERQICLKVNADDATMDYPPFASLFESIISNIDLQSIKTAKDELSAYKLLVARLKPLTGAKSPDDFEVDPQTALKYYNKFVAALPECVNACLSPIPIEAVEFKDLNTTDDTDMISSSLSNLFKRVGGVILDNDKTGSTIYEAQIIADMELAHGTIVPQLNRYLNLYFDYTIGNDHARIKYLKGVCPYTRKSKRKEYLESAQNGMNKMKIAILDGESQLEFISSLYLESALGINELMTPLNTSYTQSSSSSDGGAPTKDATELTDEGSSSRENGKNDM
nr:MAG TPA: portal protein [Caudoviricetes sp.]